MNVTSMKDVHVGDSFIRALIYGEAGGGKTHLLREFPRPMLVFDFDQKLEPLMGTEGIDVISYTSDGSAGSYSTLRKKFWSDWREATKDKKYVTLALDSLTNLDNLLINAFMEESGKNVDPAGKMAKVTLPVYGDLKNFYATLFNSMRRLSQEKNTIVLAHEKYHIDDEGAIIAIKPLVTGGMKDEISSLFKDTWYYEYIRKPSGEETRTLYYRKFRRHICASTTLRGEGKIVNPTFEKIRQEIVNKEK